MSVLTNTPLRTFTLVSLVLITVMVIGVGLVQTAYFRSAILNREGIIIRDIAQTMASRQLSLEDLENYRDAEAKQRFENSFAVLKHLSEAVRIKVYNRRNILVWSDDPALIGTRVDADPELDEAIRGGTEVVFYAAHRPSQSDGNLPAIPLVEFYVPFFVGGAVAEKPEIGGVFAFYRSAETLNQTINKANALIWLITGLGGAVLYASLFGLFRTVYQRQREAETQFSRLSTEHQRIVQMEKLSAIGMTVAEVAHQINNPLVGVMNLAQLAEREADDPERTRELLGEIRKAGDHCRAFVQRMLEFTKISSFQQETVEIGEIIEDTIALFKQSVGAKVDVVVKLPGAGVKLKADPTLLRHALFNLLSNAAQASGGEGAVTVTLSPEPGEEDHKPGWRLSVLDEGEGLSEDTQEKMFSPFFTTHPQGIGLGLSVIQHIAALHGGTVTAENRPGGGAHFAIWLPGENAGEGDDASHPGC